MTNVMLGSRTLVWKTMRYSVQCLHFLVETGYSLKSADAMGRDYPSETFRVLKEKEIRAHGEYRTRRLVLAAWDRMEASGKFRELGL